MSCRVIGTTNPANWRGGTLTGFLAVGRLNVVNYNPQMGKPLTNRTKQKGHQPTFQEFRVHAHKEHNLHLCVVESGDPGSILCSLHGAGAPFHAAFPTP